ncbi:hypothetical protein [Metapseudomonas sp. CR1201]
MKARSAEHEGSEISSRKMRKPLNEIELPITFKSGSSPLFNAFWPAKGEGSTLSGGDN